MHIQSTFKGFSSSACFEAFLELIDQLAPYELLDRVIHEFCLFAEILHF